MTVRADASSRPFEHDGVTYCFCCAGCRSAFEKDPAAYLRKGADADQERLRGRRAVDKVWRFFDDIPQVAACLPGAELTEDLGDDKYRGKVAVRMGPVKLQFAGTAEIKERDDAAKRIVVDAAGADEKGRGQAAMLRHRDAGAAPRRHAGRGGAGPAAVRRRRAVRPRHGLRRHRGPDARLRHQHADPHRRALERGVAAGPDRGGRVRPAASRIGLRATRMALRRVLRRFFLPYRAQPEPERRAPMVLWWIGNAVLLLVGGPGRSSRCSTGCSPRWSGSAARPTTSSPAASR